MRAISLRVRLTIWYTLALLLVLSLFGADVLWQQGRLGMRRVDRELDGLSATLASVVRDELREDDNLPTAAEEARGTVDAPGRAVAIFDERGGLVAARWNGLDPQSVAVSAAGGARVWTAESAGGAWRVHVAPKRFDDTTLVLLVAAPLTDVRREQHEVQEAMLIGIPIVLLLAGAGGLYLASVGLRPITDALRTQRQFMADASHELRTPVSVVRAAADVTLSREHRNEAEYREALTIVGGQAHRLGRLVEDMLVLARADSGAYPLRPVDLYLDELVADCRRAVDVLAAERGVTIRSTVGAEIPFRGDEDLLRRLVLNVLQNAVQHTPPGGWVNVDLCQEAGRVRLRISDSGSGIPPTEQGRIFDRFVQLDAARRGEGTGLGLPIARWIAEAHRGTLVLEKSGPDGSTFCVLLPAPASP